MASAFHRRRRNPTGGGGGGDPGGGGASWTGLTFKARGFDGVFLAGAFGPTTVAAAPAASTAGESIGLLLTLTKAS